MKYYVIQEFINKCNYQKDPINQLNSVTCCVSPGFLKSYFVIFSMFNDLRCEVILFVLILVEINVREYRRGNQKWTI
jgi:hypothetical protein